MKAKVFLITVIALAALVLQTETAKGDVIRDGLVSYWTFDKADVVGKKVEDVVGKHDGEMVGKPDIVVGKFGEAIVLRGPATDGDHVKVSTLDISPPNYPDITLMAWVYPTAFGTGAQKNRRFVFGHDNGGCDRGILIRDEGWRIGTGFTGDPKCYWETGASVEVDKWQHVAVVYQHEEKKITFYKDGKGYAFDEDSNLDPSGHPFLLIGAHPKMKRTYEGLIDEVAVYDRALSQDEIKRTGEGLAVEVADKLALSWGEIKAPR